MSTPRGQVETKKALIAAAIDLFDQRGHHGVSVRDIARAAGVNHGLVHRHFGSKQGLVRATVENIAEQIASVELRFDARGGVFGGIFSALLSRRVYWRVLARELLDGTDPKALQGNFPLVRAGIELVESLQSDGRLDADLDPKVVVATFSATLLGWLMFEPYLLASAGLEDRSVEDVRSAMLDVLSRVQTLVKD